MDARNRMADVKTLRCHACQDYIRFLLPDGWQQLVYRKAKTEVELNTKYKNHYIAVYEKMRDIGCDNYRVEDMDVTLISELLHGCGSFVKADSRVVKAIEVVRDDRNITDHSGENEDPEELYLGGLLTLCGLRSFIRAIDKFERSISDENRLAYRQKYISEIDALKETLDEERIELIQKVKTMDLDIQRILKSETPRETWSQISKAYAERYWVIDKKPDNYVEFEIRASDAGVIYAHTGAAESFAIIKKDYDEVERRLFLLYNAFAGQAGSAYEMKSIVDIINHCLINGCQPRDGFKRLIENVKNQGYCISQTEEGLYSWNKK